MYDYIMRCWEVKKNKLTRLSLGYQMPRYCTLSHIFLRFVFALKFLSGDRSQILNAQKLFRNSKCNNKYPRSCRTFRWTMGWHIPVYSVVYHDNLHFLSIILHVRVVWKSQLYLFVVKSFRANKTPNTSDFTVLSRYSIFCARGVYANTYTLRELEQRTDVYSIMSNWQTNCHLKLISKKWTTIQEQPNSSRTISCKAWSSPLEYPRLEYKAENNIIASMPYG